MAIAMRYPRTVLLWISLLTVAAATQLSDLEITLSPHSLVVEGTPAQRFYEDTIATFGADKITIVYLSDPDLFRQDKLAAIKLVVDAIEALPFVEKTRSLFSIPEIRLQGDLVSTQPFLQRLPESQQDAERILASALKNPFVRKNLLSPDGTALAINIYLQDPEFSTDPDYDVRVAGAIEKAIAPLAGRIAEFHQIGLPYIRSIIAQEISKEQVQFVVASFTVLLLVLALMFRRRSALIIPFLTAALSLVWLLGAMAALGVPLSVLTAVVPVLLVIVGSTEDVHLLAEYYAGIDKALGRLHAVRSMTRRLALAISLTFLTSYAGFLAVGANPVSLVREFGIVASTGLAINFLLTALLVPILLQLIGERNSHNRQYRLTGLYLRFSAFLTRFILSHRRLIVVLSIAVFTACGALASRLQVDNSILNYLPDESPVRDRALNISQKLAGIYVFQIVLDGHIDDAFERVHYLEQIQKIQRYIAQQSPFDHSNSFADYLALLNSAVNDTGEPELPDEDDVAEALMLFINPGDVREYLSADKSIANIVVRHGIDESADLQIAVRDLEAYIKHNVDPDLQVTITGQSVLASDAVNDLIVGQIKSLGLIIVTIFVVVSLLFVTPKAGLIAVIVNAFPVVALFGIMALTGIALDSATSMIAAIAVGVGVDHTMHFMVRYNQQLKNSDDELSAITRTVISEASPIGTATIALAAGFAVLFWSNFPPVYFFGLLSAMMMLFAFVATFVLALVLLSYIRLMTIWDLLGTSVRKRLAVACPLFHGMRSLQIRRIILLGAVLQFRDGEQIMQRGELGSSMFVLLKGNVIIDSIKSDGTPDRFKAASVGEVFGLAALMCGKPRVASATAVGNVEVLSLDWARLQRISRFFPRSAYRLFRNLSVLMGDRLTDQSALVTGTTAERSELKSAIDLPSTPLNSGVAEPATVQSPD
ncbi:MAG: MMPL family transporter [Gammaproteobacteria bacterium]|nr:MMPL family transporter [Gammaproteobacteria bacterium]MCP5417786.1 MMPL family transporter [Chromatiaceae bacterium]